MPLLIEIPPFHLRENITNKFENHIWELQEMLKILKSGLEAKEGSMENTSK